jgi:hypothetical protein
MRVNAGFPLLRQGHKWHRSKCAPKGARILKKCRICRKQREVDARWNKHTDVNLRQSCGHGLWSSCCIWNLPCRVCHSARACAFRCDGSCRHQASARTADRTARLAASSQRLCQGRSGPDPYISENIPNYLAADRSAAVAAVVVVAAGPAFAESPAASAAESLRHSAAEQAVVESGCPAHPDTA